MAAQASLALGLWLALAQRNWEAVKTFLDDGCISLDIPR